MKRLACLVMALLMVFALCACGGAKDTLVVGITDFAPMDYKDENGEWTGFDAELARAFAESLGKFLRKIPCPGVEMGLEYCRKSSSREYVPHRTHCRGDLFRMMGVIVDV